MPENKMPKRMTVTTHWTNGNVIQSIMDDNMVAGYIANLPADDLTSYTVAVGSMTALNPAVKVRLADVDIARLSSGKVLMKLYDRSDKAVAVIEDDAVKVQEFALRVLQQTTYALADQLKR